MRLDIRPLAALSTGWFMVIVDSTIINVALPALGRELSASITGLQWVVDAYVVTFAGLLLSAGWLADRLGAKAVFHWGLALFAVTSAGCALAPNLGALIAFRVGQGLCAALVVPASLALVQSTYTDVDVRARAVAAWAMIGGVAGGVGPLLGGVLIAGLGWRAIFWVNLPVAVLGLLLVRRFVPAGRSGLDERPRPDLTGQITAAVTLLALTAAVVDAGRSGWTAMVPLLLFAVALLAGTTFVVVERRVRHPLLPPGLVADPGIAGSYGVGLWINFAYYGSLFVLGLHLQREYHLGPLLTGLALVPQTAATVLGTWIGGRLNRRAGPRRPMLVGLPIGAAGLAALAILGNDAPYPALILPMVASGCGISFSMVAATTVVVEHAPRAQAGIASGGLNASRQVGGALGIAVLGTILATAGAVGAAAALAAGAVAYLVALACSAAIRDRPAAQPTAKPPLAGPARTS